jgi:hypothetical protein
MAAHTPRGGFVITLNHNNFVGQITVNDETFRKVAEALGIPQRAANLGMEKRLPEIKSIYIFRGE